MKACSYSLCSLALAISLTGCAGLPDQRLANEALKRGDTALAEQNYRQLADLGYSEAQVGLADIQVETRDPAKLKEAEATYRAAADISPRAQARLGRLLAAKPDATEAERQEAETLLKKAFANGEGNTLIPLAMLYLQYPQSFPGTNAQQQIDKWRAAGYPEAGLAQILLYRTQDSYDQHLDDVERICMAALTSTDICYVELATVYQKRTQPEQQAALIEQVKSAYQRGAIPATRVDSVARVLADRSLGQTDEKTAQALLEQVAPVNPGSWVSLAQLLYDFPELGDTDKLMEYIDKGRAAEQPRAELLLGRLYYEGKTVPADAQKAETHLLSAANAGEVSAHTTWASCTGVATWAASTRKRPSIICSAPPAVASSAPITPWPSCSAKATASARTWSAPGCSANWRKPTPAISRASWPPSSTSNSLQRKRPRLSACCNKSARPVAPWARAPTPWPCRPKRNPNKARTPYDTQSVDESRRRPGLRPALVVPDPGGDDR